MIGGDFNLDEISTSRFLLKAGIRGSICELDEQCPTFRRKSRNTIQESNIDHVAWTGSCLAGSYVTRDGRFVSDHIPLIGWTAEVVKSNTSARKTLQRPQSMRAGDKGLARKYQKRVAMHLKGVDLESMPLKDIIELAVKTAEEVGKTRKKCSGWSPLSRLMELQVGVIGTAIKCFHKASYNIIMRKRIHQAVSDSKKIYLNEEEKEWRKEHIKEPPAN